jgi:hypothetical protein
LPTSEFLVPSDYLEPVLVTPDEAATKVRRSVVSLSSLLAGQITRDEIELAFSSQGCGAVIVQLDQRRSDLYDRFYRLQWQLGTRAFSSITEANSAAVHFAALDAPVRRLLHECAFAVGRARIGLTGATSAMPAKLAESIVAGTCPLAAAVGRPLAANRHEFHPCVDWLIEQQTAGRLRKDENPDFDVVAVVNEQEGPRQILGRARADETQLLALYQEWLDATPDERCGHGDKYNGNVYYGAFRGHTHLDCGSLMTVLFGPGELRDRTGRAADSTTDPRAIGGTLMVVPPGQDGFTPLPYRLPCGSPYVVVFFGEVPEYASPAIWPMLLLHRERVDGDGEKVGGSRRMAVNTAALGWKATIHGVRRIEDSRFSRGQTVVKSHLSGSDLV